MPFGFRVTSDSLLETVLGWCFGIIAIAGTATILVGTTLMIINMLREF